MVEKWRAIPGWEGLYDVSDQGRIRSLPRRTRAGLRGGTMLKLIDDGKGLGYQVTCLSRESKVVRVYAHQAVLWAFVGPQPEGMEVAHEDGSPSNNVLGNLSYKTKSGNMQDSLRHGTNRNARKMCCPRCSGEYKFRTTGQRYCPVCQAEYKRNWHQQNYERSIARQRAYRADNAEHFRQYQREYKRRYRAKKKLEAAS
jgi:uncharacterized Zn finger protein (UPF0148 family)